MYSYQGLNQITTLLNTSALFLRQQYVGSTLGAVNRSGRQPCLKQSSVFPSILPHHPQFLGWVYGLVARSAEGEWLPAWVRQSDCKMCISPRLSKWCPSCQGYTAYWRLWFRSSRWIALSGAGLNDWGGALAAPSPPCLSLKVNLFHWQALEQMFPSGIMGINLEGVVWTSLYSLETWDLRSRECRAVWCWVFFFFFGGGGGVCAGWLLHEKDLMGPMK